MTIAIQERVGDYGTEVGVRLYLKAAPTVQVGSDVILTRGSGALLYSVTGLAFATYGVGDYFVNRYLTDGGGTITAFLGFGELRITADGDTAEIVGSLLSREVMKIPRAAAEITAGGSVRLTNDDVAQTLDLTVTGDAP